MGRQNHVDGICALLNMCARIGASMLTTYMRYSPCIFMWSDTVIHWKMQDVFSALDEVKKTVVIGRDFERGREKERRKHLLDTKVGL